MTTKHSSLAAAAFLALTLAAFAAPAARAWTRNPFTGNLPVCTQSAIQDNVQMVPDGTGGAILVWVDGRGAGGADLYAQRVSATGAPMWAPNGVAVCTAANEQGFVSIAPDGSGGAVLAWQDLRTGANFDVYAQRLTAAGTTSWTVNGVPVSTGAGGQTIPSIASDGAGGALIAWTDTRTDGLGDVYVQRLNGSGAAQWTANGLAVCTVAGSQYSPVVVNDGANGLIVTWEDYRGGLADLYAQRVIAGGTAQWNPNGAVVNNSAGDQTFPQMISDGAGGAIVTWQDTRAGAANVDIYAQRLAPNSAALWATAGAPVCAATASQYVPRLASDGSGGAVIAWEDFRASNTDVYAQRIYANGAPAWSVNGIGMCTAAGTQNHVAIAGDGSGGAIVAWEDFRGPLGSDIFAAHVNLSGQVTWTPQGDIASGAANSQFFPQIVADASRGAIVAWTDYRNNGVGDIYAEHLDEWGVLGDVSAVVRSVRDVPNDQGGWVKVSFAASPLDQPGVDLRGNYSLWRAVPARLAVASGRGITHDLDEATATGKWYAEPGAAMDYAWEQTDYYVNAVGLAEYSLTVSTTGDSMPGSNPRTAYRVRFQNYSEAANRYRDWFSAPDSGYSVDNRAPVTPAPFTGVRTGAATRLAWWPNHEADLAGYRVYRGIGTSFVPGPGTLMASLVDTGYVESSATGYVYKVTAVDIHGNESVPATYATPGTVDAPTNVPTLAFAAPSPNPARGATTLRWSLPAAGTAKLEVYDAAGRRVRVLHDGSATAGEHVVRFELRDGSGRALPSGVYLARLEAAGQVLVRRVSAVE